MEINGNSDQSFFRASFKKHAPFGIDSVKQTMPNQGFDQEMSLLLMRVGDLVCGIDVEFIVPGLAPQQGDTHAYWTNALGYAVIREAKIEFAGLPICRDYGLNMYLWEALTGMAGKRCDEMVGKRASEAQLIADAQDSQRSYWVTMQFWFCRYIGTALPLVAIQHHNVYFTLITEPVEKMYITGPVGKAPLALTANRKSKRELRNESMQVHAYVRYVYLTEDERDNFTENDHQYIMMQVQRTEKDLTSQLSGLAEAEIELPYQHPVYWMTWVIRSANNLEKKNYFNFSGINGREPVERARLDISSTPRVTEREGRYFRLVDPKIQGLNVPRQHIYSFGFGIKAENFFQPNGSFNWTKADTPKLILRIQAGMSSAIASVFAHSYNLFRVVGNVGGPAWAL